MYYAHSKNRAKQRQGLVEHLRCVANRTKKFATPLGASDLGYALGLWHDLGKFDDAWQEYLLECEIDPNRRNGKKIDHKAAGTLYARDLGVGRDRDLREVAPRRTRSQGRVRIETRLCWLGRWMI
jgi:CRISPR-associated endonuclease Cas3-HD